MDQAYIKIKCNEDCFGCRSCEQICPNNCILIKKDSEGFHYPIVDTLRCSECGLCKAHCPCLIDTSQDDQLSKTLVYAATSIDSNILKNSSSGGVFSVLASEILRKGGVVFGCAFDDKFEARHIAVDKLKDLKKLQGSKYVASDLNDTYSRVKTIVKKNRWVLYSGTGCNIAGLKAFLGKSYPSLITADIICHGTPSQKLFSKNIDYLHRKLGEKILSYEFRCKEKRGWGLNYQIKTRTKNIVKQADSDPYYASFLTGKTYRHSCYACKYAKPEREGDFTLGDFWGIELFHPEFYSSKGISLLMINTKKGLDFFHSIKPKLNYIPSRMEWAAFKNGNLFKPTKKPPFRDFIYNDLDLIDFKNYSDKYLRLKGNEKYKAILKNMLPKKTRIFINQITHKLKKKNNHHYLQF